MVTKKLSFMLNVFQHTAARRRLVMLSSSPDKSHHCFNTQPPEGGWPESAPKRAYPRSFNTQPPEGGWAHTEENWANLIGFNTQPPEGGWALNR